MADDTILSRIHQRLAATGKSARKASMDAGKSPDLIRDIERTRAKSVTLSSLEALAFSLGVTPEWLAFGIGDQSAGGKVSVPIVSWVSAGGFADPGAIDPQAVANYVEASGLPPGQWFALKVEGDSMDRISPPGSVIFVNRSDRRLVPNGCYVICNEEGEATYKRYRASPDRFEPVSTNKDLDALFPNGAITVVGRVRRSVLEM